MATLFDLQRLAAFTDGDAAVEAELLALFVATAERYLADLASSVDQAERWRATAHSLKGAAGNIGAAAMAELAAAAERTTPDPKLLARLESTFAATRASLPLGAA